MLMVAQLSCGYTPSHLQNRCLLPYSQEPLDQFITVHYITFYSSEIQFSGTYPTTPVLPK